MFTSHIKYLKDNPKGYWFRAKLYGYGWIPAKWQGWMVLVIFIGAVLLNLYRIFSYSTSENEAIMSFVPQLLIMIGILITICYKTGEKPRWQWGVPKKYKK
ncbi:MAG: hypothetical protein P1V18_05380 [Candidatus Gracilibacteria bacterium]|nr:hypothetical protein [Candidatus Gracilibacteria bacterium]